MRVCLRVYVLCVVAWLRVSMGMNGVRNDNDVDDVIKKLTKFKVPAALVHV